MSKAKLAKLAQLQKGFHVIYTDEHESPGHHLAFDMGELPTPRRQCTGGGDVGNCLIFFTKYAEDLEEPPTPKMVAWGATSANNIVKPTEQLVSTLLLEENEYKKQRDKYAEEGEKFIRAHRRDQRTSRLKHIFESIIILNREINRLYDEHFPKVMPSSEIPLEMLGAQESIAYAAVPPGPRLFSGRLHEGSTKQSRKLNRDINRLRRTLGRKIGYRNPLTETDEWNIFKDEQGLDDTSSDEEEDVPRKKVLVEEVRKWGDYSSDEDHAGDRRAGGSKCQKKKTRRKIRRKTRRKIRRKIRRKTRRKTRRKIRRKIRRKM